IPIRAGRSHGTRLREAPAPLAGRAAYRPLHSWLARRPLRRATCNKKECDDAVRSCWDGQMTRSPVTSLIAAAGAGTRLQGGPPKGLRSLGGIPLFVHALRAFDTCGDVDSHVVVVPRGSADAVVPDRLGLRARVMVVEGGARRQDSVLAGLAEALRTMGGGSADAPRLVAVHDAARPFPDATLIARTIEGARAMGAAVPVVAVSDTVREVGEDGASLRVLDRGALRLAQTPQTARLDWLLEA